MKSIAFCASVFTLITSPAMAADDHDAYAVEAAKLALPTIFHETAKIISRDTDGTETVVREGTADMICTISSVSDQARLNVFCNNSGLQEYGRAMRAMRQDGISLAESTDLMKAKIEAGEVSMPKMSSVAYVYRGGENSYGATLSEIEGQSWQLIFTPFANGADLGLAEEEDGSMPYVMAAGTPAAHIMVSGSTTEAFE